MEESDARNRWSNLSLEAQVAVSLQAHLEQIPVGSEFKVEPSAVLSSALELYMSLLLSDHHPAWHWESLDGVFVVRAKKTGPDTAELAGMCILLSDQAATPFLVRLRISPSCDAIASYRVLVGEPGKGPLGISGPLWTSSHAQILLATFNSRFDHIQWVYQAEGAAD